MENVKEKANKVNVDKIQDNNTITIQKDNINEKMIIICLIIISLMLLFASFFFIHDIKDRGRIENDASTSIPEPDNDVLGETTDKDENGEITDKDENGETTDKDENGEITDDENIIIDNSDRFKVKQDEKEFNELKEIDVFKNKYFNYSPIIAPGVEGEYNFTVENEGESNFIYDIAFSEENPHKINMVYKLKLNGKYVLGNENDWVKGRDLSRKGSLLKSRANDIYTVEWRWEDTNYDTEIGEQGGENGAYYKLHINVVAEQDVD